VIDIVSIQLKEISGPLYIKLAESLQDLILQDRIKDGDKLPSIRKLSEALHLNNSTITAAYRYLERKGILYTKLGSGTYCLPENRVMATEQDHTFIKNIQLELPEGGIDFAGNTPGAELFPVEEFKEAIKIVLDTDGGHAFEYHDSEGDYGLREALITFSKQHYQIDSKLKNIIVTSGAQQAIDLISKVCVHPGDTVLAENPSYLGARTIFAMRGANIIGIPVDQDGMNISLLEHYVKRYHPKLLYTMPIYQTPTGVCMSPQKREELIKLAKRHEFYIIEDDMLSDLCLNDDKILPLKSQDDGECVIYVKSFSKMLMPGIRTAYMIVPSVIVDDLIKAKYTTDISTSGFIQRALSIYIKSGAWDAHVKRLLPIYKERLQTVAEYAKYFREIGMSFELPKGGLGIWLTLPPNIHELQIYYKCLDKKVLIVPGSNFYISPMMGSERHIRLSYAVPDSNELKKGMEVIYQSLKSITQRLGKSKLYL